MLASGLASRLVAGLVAGSVAGLVAGSVAGCGSKGTAPRATQPGFDPATIAKTHSDRFAEAHQREIFASLRRITEKLYRRNPREFKKSGALTIEQAVERVYGPDHNWRLQELGNRRDIDALNLAFKPDFSGDRVLALSVGLASMVQTAFNDKVEFFVTDELDAQRLYNAARNMELSAWKLNNTRDAEGTLILLSNEAGWPRNLSFEREFGRIIGQLDVLSKVVAGRNEGLIVSVAQSMASAVFLPVK